MALDRILVLILDGMVLERLDLEVGSEGESVRFVEFGDFGPGAFARVGLVTFPAEAVFLLLRRAYRLMIPNGKLVDEELAGGEIAGMISAEEKSGEDVVTVMLPLWNSSTGGGKRPFMLFRFL